MVCDGEPLEGNEFFQVTFRGRTLKVAGLVLPMDRRTAIPTVFRIRGKRPDGRWEDLARLDDAHILQLIDRLQESPGEASLGFDLGERELRGLRLIATGAEGFWGWRISELEVWVPKDRPDSPETRF